MQTLCHQLRGNEGTSIKAEFKLFSDVKEGNAISEFSGELLLSYKAKVLKLSAENILIVMKQNDQFSTQILAKNFGNATSSTLFHELKTLLNAVMGSFSLLEDTIDKEHMNYYKFFLSSFHILTAKINDIFDYTQIQIRQFNLHISTINTEALLKDISEICKWIAIQKRLDFTTSMDSNVPSIIKGDYDRIKQILLNLITKTIDYTDLGRITLRLKISKKKKIVVFQVKSLDLGMHNSLLTNIRNFSPKYSKLRYRSDSIDAIKNMEEMYLEITQLISKEMKSKIIVKSKKDVCSQFNLYLSDSLMEENNYIENTFRSPNKINKNDLTAVDFDIPTEQETASESLRKIYLFSTKSTPDFNRTRKVSLNSISLS